MLAGELYFSLDKALVKERQKAKEIIFEINNLRPSDIEGKNRLMTLLLGMIGANSQIELPFRCDYGYNIEIGDNFFSNYNCTILDCAKVTIGDYVQFGPNVSLFTAGHPVDAEKRNEGREYAFPITIGNNVWIGGNTVINPGINIGHNTVIGSGSVVTRDIPDNIIAFGNPCKPYRKITGADRKYYFRKLEF